MMKPALIVPEEQPFTLAALPPSRAQKRLALAVVLASLVAFFITAGPLSTFQLGRIDAFVPAYGTALFVNDLITAVLLFNQFAILRQRALLVIASGYLFTALMVIPWTLTFPGVFTPAGLLGAGLQTTGWLYNLWHVGFPTFVLAYVLVKDADPTKGLWRGSAGAAILSSVAVTAAVVFVATFIVTAGHAHLPGTTLDTIHASPLWLYIAGYQILLCVAALVLLWARRRSVLDLWLMVVMCAYVIEVCLIAFPLPVRFSVGWYAGRIFGLASGSLVLFVLLYEITTLYAQLLRAVLAQRREREARLMTGDALSASIAHEIKQPLGAMITSANAGLNWLDRGEPNLDKIREVLRRIVTAGHRADAVIENVRARFKTGARSPTSLDTDDVIQETLAIIVPEDQPLTLANLSPSQQQRRLALAVALALLVVFFITAGPLSSFQLGRIDAFIPAYGTALFVNDLITAVLLFNQFATLRSRALLAISTGYLFAALMVIPWMLTFPGGFSPGGLLGAGLQSASWLYLLWHAGFPTFVIAYALVKDADPTKGLWRGSAVAAILSSVAVTAAVVCVATFLVTAGDAYLPRVSIDPVRYSKLALYLSSCLILWNALALTLLWMRRRSVLDLWLMLVVCTCAIEIYLIAFTGLARFGTGWYVGRVVGLVSSILVLCVLLYEITTLYAQLLRAVLAQRREREARLMTGDTVSASIAHEVKQPLGAIITSANAGLNWLDRVEPDFDEVRDAFRLVVTAGHRADAVIENIRAHFKLGARTRTSLHIDDVIQETLAVVRDQLQTHRVAVRAGSDKRLPRIRGEQVQLQQVLVNLITNAIDSMATKNGERVLSIRSEIHRSGCVMVSVEDTGKGLEPGAVDRIFDPMFTTKTHGMGMGLSICRSIIEAHEGQLWVTSDEGRGAIFHFTLPVDPGSPS